MTAHTPASSASPAQPAARGPDQTYSESVPGAPMEAVICLDELERRPRRPRQDALLNEAAARLLAGLTSSPQSVLQSLADTILEVLQCDSAGVSLINGERTRFVWPAIAGVWAPHVGGGTPIHFGPCGDVLAVKRSLHMREVHKRYTYFSAVPLVHEVLLSPFSVDGEVVGTIWAVMHEPPHNARSRTRQPAAYDREDLRLLEALAELATSAYQVWKDPNAA